MTLQIPSLSVEYLHLPVTGDDTTGMPVQVAVVLEDTEPAPGDWNTATWVAGAATLLIGPGTVLELADGIYGAWVKITATPEIPVLYCGQIVIT